MEIADNILDYIPQRPPFVMIDKLVSVSDTLTTSQLLVSEENIFCEDGVFYEGGLIENVAQTVAAGAGYRLRQQHAKPLAGVIGTIKKLNIVKRPQSGEIINTEVSLLTDLGMALVVEGKIFLQKKLILSCQMNIFILQNSKFYKP